LVANRWSHLDHVHSDTPGTPAPAESTHDELSSRLKRGVGQNGCMHRVSSAQIQPWELSNDFFRGPSFLGFASHAVGAKVTAEPSSVSINSFLRSSCVPQDPFRSPVLDSSRIVDVARITMASGGADLSMSSAVSAAGNCTGLCSAAKHLSQRCSPSASNTRQRGTAGLSRGSRARNMDIISTGTHVCSTAGP
jgi:hypothetical protein